MHIVNRFVSFERVAVCVIYSAVVHIIWTTIKDKLRAIVEGDNLVIELYDNAVNLKAFFQLVGNCGIIDRAAI
ncbi:hypothetical protein D3C87_1846330 [compost metagenome]